MAVVIPVYNEEEDLPRNVPKLFSYLTQNMSDFGWEIVIADNASTDKTAEIGQKLAQKPGISYMRLEQKGRGRALKRAWTDLKSEYLAYMDVDLSSDLSFFRELIEKLKDADVAIGSRLVQGAKVYGRTLLREIMSRGYNLLIKILFWTSFSDAQCGFKAIRREVAQKLLPYIVDNEWFFDSELLIVVHKAGYKVAEVPIVWRDDPRSTVKVAKTAWGDMKGLVRLFVTRPWRKLKK